MEIKEKYFQPSNLDFLLYCVSKNFITSTSFRWRTFKLALE
jgi:hypothetical protein